jgi:taurine---2-oxoglutarate transaminase
MTKESLPYFITWTAQKYAKTFELLKTTQHELIIQKKGSKSTLKIVDLSSLSYQASFGLKNKNIMDALKEQAAVFPMALPKNTFDLKEKVAKKLNQLAARKSSPQGKIVKQYKTFFTLSGAEGIENALKIVRQVTGRNIILARKRSYHGATMGALAITGDWRNNHHLLPRQWTIRIPEPDEDPKGEKLEAIILKHGPQKIAAFCLETITGGNGVVIPPASYYKKIHSLATKYKIKMIMDEVVCGVHRTGPFFGIDHYPFLKPDFIVMAKGLTGGLFPMGAVLVCEKIAKYYQDHILSCGLTHYGHPLGLACVDSVLKMTSDKKFLKHLDLLTLILSRYKEDIEGLGLIVRQKGLLMAIDFPQNIPLEKFIENGVYLSVINNSLIIAPHLNIPEKLLNQSLNKLFSLLQTLLQKKEGAIEI